MNAIDADTLWAWEDSWKEKDETLQKSLKIDDLRHVFLCLGKDLSQKDLKDVCNGGNSCSFEAFKQFMSNQPRQAAAAIEIKNSVHVLAQSSGGTMRTAELRLLLTSQGEKLAHDEAATVVADADPRKTGFVDVEPFADLITSA